MTLFFTYGEPIETERLEINAPWTNFGDPELRDRAKATQKQIIGGDHLPFLLLRVFDGKSARGFYV